MYAIVKTGGKQYKVAEGDVISIEKLTAAPGEEVAFPAILFVDGDEVTHDPAALAQVAVTAEVVAQTKGPKIRIHKYKNKTGYHKRMGHRQKLTEVRILSVGTGRPITANPTAAPAQPAAEAPVDASAATMVEAPAPAETVTPASAVTTATALEEE